MTERSGDLALWMRDIHRDFAYDLGGFYSHVVGAVAEVCPDMTMLEFAHALDLAGTMIDAAAGGAYSAMVRAEREEARARLKKMN